MGFEVEFKNEEVSEFMAQLLKRTNDVKDGNKAYVGLLSAIVYRDVMTHFKEEKGSEGRWKTWSPSYQEHMKKIGRAGNKILQFNGRLRQTFQPTDNKTSSRGITWFNNAKTKSGYPYAWGHQEGDGKLPKRDFMWLSNSALDEMARQTLAYMIQEGI